MASAAMMEQFLPAMFRRRKSVGDPMAEEAGLAPANILMGQGSPALSMGNVAAGTEPDTSNGRLVAEPLPNIARPRMEAAPVEDVTPDRSIDPTQTPVEMEGRAPLVTSDKRGRPKLVSPASVDDPSDRARQLHTAVAEYQPQDSKGWWDRWLKPGLEGAGIGFLVGGPGGALGGAGMRLLQSAKNPKMADEAWQRRELGRTGEAVKAINDQETADLNTADKIAGINQKRASAGLSTARANDLKNPKKNQHYVERKDGVYAVDPATNKAVKISDIPAEAGPSGSTHYVERTDGVYGVNAEHPEGFKLGGIPAEPAKPGEDTEFTNKQINGAISAAQAEQAKIDAGLNGVPDTIESTDIFGSKRVIPNPKYVRAMTRRQQLDDQIRDWQVKLKAPKVTTAPTTKAKSDPLGLFQ